MLKVKYIIPTVILALVLMAVEIAIIRNASEYEPKAEAVFASVRIPEGTVIEEDMLVVREIDTGLLHKLAVKSREAVAGKIAGVDLEKGEMILSSRVGNPEKTGMIAVERSDSRLFTVEFNADQANGWQLKSGCYVDIIFIPDKKASVPSAGNEQGLSGPGNSTGEVMRMEHIRVAALVDDSGNIICGDMEESSPRYVSFEVEEGQDEFLAYAKSNGRLELSVIPDDTVQESAPGRK